MQRRPVSSIAFAALAVGIAATVGAQYPAPQPAPAATPAPARPPIAHYKVDGTDNVYVFRNGGNQSMFIVTSEGVIATDPIGYGKPTAGQDYLGEIRKVTDKPIKYLIYSHQHFDHAAGGKALKDAGATVIAHRRAKERLERLNDPHTVVPDEAVGDEGRTIRLGGTTLELKYMGAHHSDSSLIMLLPKERIVFLVDTFPVGTLPARGMTDMYPLEMDRFGREFLALQWDRMIPGHPGPGDRLGTRKDVEDQLAFYRVASDEMKKLAHAGKCWDTAEKEFTIPGFESWPNYAAARPLIATRYCALWGRGF